MSTSTVVYTGNLRTTCLHLQSGQEIVTDAPTDNHGLGQSFSPTDLMATSLATCMITVMGITAQGHNMAYDGVKASLTKVMASNPRRIGKIQIELHFPEQGYSAKHMELLKHSALTCPVAKSLHPDIEVEVEFNF